ARIDTEQHLGGGVAHLQNDPLRVFTSRQPAGSGGVAGLVRTPPAQTQVAQQRVPNPVVVGARSVRRTFAGAEDELAAAGFLPLAEERLVNRLGHIDLTL